MRILSLNIEGHRHRDRIKDFFLKESFDVIFLQELFKNDVEFFKDCADSTYTLFSPMIKRQDFRGEQQLTKSPIEIMGVGVFSKLPINWSATLFYSGSITKIPFFSTNENQNVNHIILAIDIATKNKKLRLATTHFTWSPEGQATDLQREHLTKMLQICETFKIDFICGDFNAPRGREIFARIEEHYTDNVPKDVTTTLDKNFHRAGDLQYVVDGLFTKPPLVMTHTKVHSGISDHMGVSGELCK